jgi:DNA-directed RNA polymerase specialized sigma24 family protein
MKSDCAILAEIIKDLPHEDQVVLDLRHTRELSFREMAYVLELPVVTVVKHYTSVKEQVMEAFEDRLRRAGECHGARAAEGKDEL